MRKNRLGSCIGVFEPNVSFGLAGVGITTVPRQARDTAQGGLLRQAPQQASQQSGARQHTAWNYNKQKTSGRPVRVGTSIDVSDVEVWKKAQIISRYFPGTFSELMEG